MGTSLNFFTDFHYGNRLSVTFNTGQPFNALFDVVIGAEVAKQLHYKVGDKIILAHGTHESSHAEHGDKPFTISGILNSTGTPTDRTVLINLEAIKAIHLDWQSGMPIPGLSIPAEYVKKFNLTPESVTAVLVGLKNRSSVFTMQRYINDYKVEPLTAILPSLALDQLWQVLGKADNVLLLVSTISVIVGFVGLMVVILASLNERRRELAILRSVGANPFQIFCLLVLESALIVFVGAILACILLALFSWCAAPFLMSHYGIMLKPTLLNTSELKLLSIAVGAGVLLSLLPAYQAYRLSLADGLIPRI
jgi:putative ABC transport system permease protein